jgi:hypothetical protein
MVSPNASSIVKFASYRKKLNRSGRDILLTIDNKTFRNGDRLITEKGGSLRKVYGYNDFRINNKSRRGNFW